MTCESLPLPGGGFAIVCGRSSRLQRCRCGAPATLLCDWILQKSVRPRARRTKTCDALLCSACSMSPAPDKDLCPDHACAFEAWKADRSLAETANQPGELSDG